MIALKKSNIACNVSLHRQSDGSIHIEIGDERSRIKFVDVMLNDESFADFMFGHHQVQASAEITSLQHVGKKKETRVEKLELSARWLKAHHVDQYNVSRLEKAVWNNFQREGWFLNSTLRSQDSVERHDDGIVVKVTYFRYVK